MLMVPSIPLCHVTAGQLDPTHQLPTSHLVAHAAATGAQDSVWNYTVSQYEKPFSMSAFRNKVLVVVNIASA